MKINTIVILLFLTVQSFGQEIVFEIQNTTLKECIKIEEKVGSELIPTTRNHISRNGQAQPIKYQRHQELIPNLIVSYKFKEKDSTLNSILYEWDVSNFEKEDNNQKPKEFQKALITKYKELKKKIAKDFGQPKVKRNYSNISRLDSLNTFVENSKWITSDTTEIELYTTVSNYYEKKGAMTINPVHRIRLYLRKFQPKMKPPTLNEKRKIELESLTIKFLSNIEKNEVTKSKELIANSIKPQVTNEVLKQISNSIGNISEYELSATGIELGLDGGQYTILNYSRVNNLENNKLLNFKVVFNNKNEIVSVK